MVRAQNFDEQNFDELIVGFIGNALANRENFDESLAVRQIRQSVPPSNFCAIRYIYSLQMQHSYPCSYHKLSILYNYLISATVASSSETNYQTRSYKKHKTVTSYI